MSQSVCPRCHCATCRCRLREVVLRLYCTSEEEFERAVVKAYRRPNSEQKRYLLREAVEARLLEEMRVSIVREAQARGLEPAP